VYISLIIPSYKGASLLSESIPPLLQYLSEKKFSFEIIVVDDGSQDNGETEEIVHRLNLTFIQNDKNRGKGNAVKRGMLLAKGEYILFTDADIPFEYDSIEKALYYMAVEGFDMAIGDRFLMDSTYFKEISLIRKISSNIFAGIVNWFISIEFIDTQCGFKGFKATVAKDFAFDVELLHISSMRNYNIKPFSINLRMNNDFSTVKIIPQAFAMFLDLFRIKYYQIKGYYNEAQYKNPNLN
jgi:dolichyl-phosphate beta-glucosyltransferase